MRKRNSLFVILLSALLMISMMSAMAFAKDKNEEPKKEKAEKHYVVKTDDVSVQGDPLTTAENVHLWVGGQPVQDGYSGAIDGACTKGTASVSFDENGDATLTLKDATINGWSIDSDYATANIIVEGINLTIVLEGESIVGSSEQGETAGYAIDIQNVWDEEHNLLRIDFTKGKLEA